MEERIAESKDSATVFSVKCGELIDEAGDVEAGQYSGYSFRAANLADDNNDSNSIIKLNYSLIAV